MHDNRLIRLSDVLKILPIGKSTWWKGVAEGRYPAPIKLGPRLTCWRLDQVLQLASNQTKQADGANDDRRSVDFNNEQA